MDAAARRRRLRTLHAARARWRCCRKADHYGLVWTMTPAKARAMLALARRRVPRGARAAISARASRGFARVSRAPHVSVAPRIRAADGRAAQRGHRQRGAGAASDRRPGLQPRRARRVRTGRRRSSARRATRWATRAMLAAFAARRRSDRYAGIAFTHGLTQLFATRLGVRALAARPRAHAARRGAAGEEGVHARDAVRLVLNVRSLSVPRRAVSALNKFCATDWNGARRKAGIIRAPFPSSRNLSRSAFPDHAHRSLHIAEQPRRRADGGRHRSSVPPVVQAAGCGLRGVGDGGVESAAARHRQSRAGASITRAKSRPIAVQIAGADPR